MSPVGALSKLVVTRSLQQATEWQNSAILRGDLVTAVRELKQTQDVVITGSASIVSVLRTEDLVDEMRAAEPPASPFQQRTSCDAR